MGIWEGLRKSRALPSTIRSSLRRLRHFCCLLCSPNPKRPNQSMKPTAPSRNAFSVFATAPFRGLSLSSSAAEAE